MGRDGHDSHGAEGDYKMKVWSMTGGPNCRPKYWRSNTVFALFEIFLVHVALAVKFVELDAVLLVRLGAFSSYMDKTESGKKASDEVTRESLISISYSVPDTAPAPESSPPIPNDSKKLVNGAAYDPAEKYRAELMSIADQLPEKNSPPANVR
ncbi:hypothetical protein ACFE04_018236 [Oxalis oulophora]